MRKLTRNSIFSAAVATAALGLTAGTAFAAGPPPYTGTISVSATGATGTSIGVTVTNTTNVTAKDLTTLASITCTKATGTGTAKLGSGISPNGSASLTAATFSSPANPGGACSGPLGITVQVTADNLPWSISVDPSTVVNGVSAKGAMTGVKAHIVGSDNCHATVTGPGGGTGTLYNGSYTDSTGILKFDSTGVSDLRVATVDANCDPSLINAGDPITLLGSFKVTPVSPATGFLTINTP
ncbi:hypothetical protein [Actinomadura oligospora]|uniref:hypothetical protein n=1 Tax=Actinomadura oligospora TaxID=111804 RepID=UPI00047EC39D|nr:hypothetical protein [Actinomadura oligospora]